ncbi:MAG: hypothetical protein H3C39_05400 [Flavobacteriia bacterium]|nr:hypothetical protein [Flavobacteriia bacterium]
MINKAKYLLLIVISFSLNSCVTSKVNIGENNLNERLTLDLKSNDFSKSSKEAIIFIKELIENPKVQTFEVEIYNFHRGIYTQKSIIEKRNNYINIQTNIIGMDNSKKSYNQKIKTFDFVSQLEILEENAESQSVIAGNYQKIYVNFEQSERLFQTRKAFGLMTLL